MSTETPEKYDNGYITYTIKLIQWQQQGDN